MPQNVDQGAESTPFLRETPMQEGMPKDTEESLPLSLTEVLSKMSVSPNYQVDHEWVQWVCDSLAFSHEVPRGIVGPLSQVLAYVRDHYRGVCRNIRTTQGSNTHEGVPELPPGWTRDSQHRLKWPKYTKNTELAAVLEREIQHRGTMVLQEVSSSGNSVRAQIVLAVSRSANLVLLPRQDGHLTRIAWKGSHVQEGI